MLYWLCDESSGKQGERVVLHPPPIKHKHIAKASRKVFLRVMEKSILEKGMCEFKREAENALRVVARRE